MEAEQTSLDVIRDVLPDDPMYFHYPGAAEQYFEYGPSALRSIELAMSAANLERVERVLDFACGGGRVLRYLKVAFPDAELTACDTWPDGLEFCVQTFGAKGVVSAVDPADVKLDGPFDLIWCGSLLTHVDREPFVEFVRLFESCLAPGGVLVFTTRVGLSQTGSAAAKTRSHSQTSRSIKCYGTSTRRASASIRS